MTERTREAVRLHRGMYEAQSKGDMKWIQENTTKAYQKRFQKSLDRFKGKPPSITVKNPIFTTSYVPGPWPLSTLLPTLFRTYKIDSDTCGALPISKDAIIRQAVVRISSIRSADGKADEKFPEDEHIVMQQLIWEGKPEQWLLAGFSKPSTIKEVQKFLDASREETKATLMDRLRNILPSSMTSNMNI